MKGLILCGGKGKRLRPLTHTAAKQLVPVANKPILYYVIENLLKAGVNDLGVVISPETGTDIIKAINEENWDSTFTFIFQKEPGGLAHAVKVARNFLQYSPFVMYLGDNLVANSIKPFLEDFQREQLDGLVLLKEVDNPAQFGIAKIDNQGDITCLVEKPKNFISNLALVGVYFFSPVIHNIIDELQPSPRGELEITDAIQRMLVQKKKVGWRKLDKWWLDTGKKDDMLTANTLVLDEWCVQDIKGSIDPDSCVTGRVTIGTSSMIINSIVRGPTAIGNGCMIRDSFIGPFTSIGNYSSISCSVIEHSVLMENVIIDQVDRLEDSLLGKNARVSHHTTRRKSFQLLLGDDSVVEF